MTEEFKKQIETEARQAVTELLAQRVSCGDDLEKRRLPDDG